MDSTATIFSSVYLASKSDARADAVRKLQCKQGFKQQGAVCKPIKEGQEEVASKSGQESPKNKALFSGKAVKNTELAVGAIAIAYMGIYAFDQRNIIKEKGLTDAYAASIKHGNKISEAIADSGLSKEQKEKAQNLLGATKAYLAKQVLESRGFELVDIDKESNSFTYRDTKSKSIVTIGSAGSNVFTFRSNNSGDVNGFPKYDMAFQVNESFAKQEGLDRKQAVQIIKMTKKAFKKQIELLPDDALLSCEAFKDDKLGEKRQSIYEKEGFSSLPGINSKYLFAVKNQGKFSGIPESQQKHIASMLGARGDSTYESARQKVREDTARKLQCKQGFKQQGAVCKPVKEGLTQIRSLPTNKNRVSNPLIAGASLLGLSTAAYIAATQKYRANFNESASIAKEESKKINIEDIPDNKEQITFSVGGFYGTEGVAASRKGEKYLDYKLSSEILPDIHHNVSHENKEFNVGEARNKESKLEVGVSAYVEHYKQILGTTIGKGYNTESRKLAAKILAYHAKYPDKPINSIGHSAGGMINRETAKILEIADPTSKNWFTAVNLGSAHFGMIPEMSNVKTIAIRSDAYLKTVGPPPSDTIWVGDKNKAISADDHQVRSYMNNTEVREEIKKILDRPSKQSKGDSVRSISYIAAKELARNDAKIRVNVPAKNGRKAYSYYREGKEAIDEPEINNRQTVRPMPVQPQVSSTVSAVTEKAAKEDLYNLMNIRDLKKEAQDRGVLRYSYMTRDQLQSAIKIHDADPEHRENIRKSLQNQKDLATLKKVKSSEVGRAISTINPTLGRQYNLLSAIARKYEKNPTEALIYALPAILGTTKALSLLLKQRRATNIKESAGAAVTDADKYKEEINENASPEGVNFYVGGYGRGSKDLYNRVANSPFASKEDTDWIKKKSENVVINRGGEDQRSHNAYQSVLNDITTGYKVTMNNTLNRGKSKESVELAAKLYAHGSKYRTDADGVKSLPALQVLAAEDGGIVARDAMEILMQMPDGNKIAKRVKLVTLGTPYFGESKVDIPEVNLVGDGDPWGSLPFNKGNQTKRASAVSGASQQDYTASADVVGKVYENMRSGLSDRTVIDKESVKAAKKDQESADNEGANREKAANDAEVKAERDRRKNAADDQFRHETDMKLREKAGNDPVKLDKLQKDVVAVREAQEAVDKDRKKVREEVKKQERAKRDVKK